MTRRATKLPNGAENLKLKNTDKLAINQWLTAELQAIGGIVSQMLTTKRERIDANGRPDWAGRPNHPS